MKQHIAKALLAASAAMMGVACIAWTTLASTSFTNNQTDIWVNVAGADQLGSSGTGTAKLIDSIKTAINWVLSILGIIALIILLYGGFNMVTAAGDDWKYKKGFTILRQAGIGLIFIWVAWLFVNIIMWFIGKITT
jgi:Flp pilus assembly protein TadB